MPVTLGGDPAFSLSNIAMHCLTQAVAGESSSHAEVGGVVSGTDPKTSGMGDRQGNTRRQVARREAKQVAHREAKEEMKPGSRQEDAELPSEGVGKLVGVGVHGIM